MRSSQIRSDQGSTVAYYVRTYVHTPYFVNNKGFVDLDYSNHTYTNYSTVGAEWVFVPFYIITMIYYLLTTE